MKVRVIVNDICDSVELNQLINDSGEVFKFTFNQIEADKYYVTCNMEFKCSLLKFMALKKYAKNKGDKVKVEKL